MSTSTTPETTGYMHDVAVTPIQQTEYHPTETIVETLIEKPKYCSDCHWSRNKHTESHLWGCDSPRNAIKDHGILDDRKVDDWIDLVTGKPRKLATYCTAARKNDELCGYKGLWFQTSNEVYPFLSSKDFTRAGDVKPKTPLHKLGLDDL